MAKLFTTPNLFYFIDKVESGLLSDNPALRIATLKD